MLGVHIDDGLDTDVAQKNIQALCKKAGLDLRNIKPESEQYRDLTLSFFKASIPNLAIPQDNLILAALTDATKEYDLKYLLHGSNFAMESILQSGNSYTHLIKKQQKHFLFYFLELYEHQLFYHILYFSLFITSSSVTNKSFFIQ